MLARPFRFHGHQSVRRVYRQGRSVRNELGSLHVYADPRKQRTRVAVVVSRKVNKSAVVRNRIRRRVYEVVRMHPAHKTFTYEMVFTIYRLDTADIPITALKQQVDELLKKAKIT